MKPVNWVWIARMVVGIFDNWKNSIALLDNKIAHHRRKRRRAMTNILALRKEQMAILSTLTLPRTKQWEVKRKKVFWENQCQVLTEEKFKHFFRLSRKSFATLCGILKELEKFDTNMRKAIPVEKRVAVALYTLGTTAEYQKIGNVFGIGKSTVCNILIEFCKSAWNALQPHYLNTFLTREKIEECVQGFESLGFPQCLGLLDCRHIEVHIKGENDSAYRNSKLWHSTILLALVDSRNRFLHINVDSPGSHSDSYVYEHSSLSQLMHCDLLREMSKTICDVDVPVYILGDGAFRFSTHLMKPYPCSPGNTWQQNYFNHVVQKCRQIVTDTFEQLNGRFLRITKGLDNKIENTSVIIKACCALHNFLTERNDLGNEEWLATRRKRRSDDQPNEIVIVNDGRMDAEKIRHALVTHFSLLRKRAADGADDTCDRNEAAGDDARSSDWQEYFVRWADASSSSSK